ncbi:MAG TPA: hypothetical protein VJ934_01470 [Desulfomicrobiaceae bacterium]|nr:hypothetical protein [Desulfomicrobiaceae bacterium]
MKKFLYGFFTLISLILRFCNRFLSTIIIFLVLLATLLLVDWTADTVFPFVRSLFS